MKRQTDRVRESDAVVNFGRNAKGVAATRCCRDVSIRPLLDWAPITIHKTEKPPLALSVGLHQRLEDNMRTIAQKRALAKKLKAGTAILITALVFTPKLDDLAIPSIPFPFVSTAIAAESE